MSFRAQRGIAGGPVEGPLGRDDCDSFCETAALVKSRTDLPWLVDRLCPPGHEVLLSLLFALGPRSPGRGSAQLGRFVGSGRR
jgi:hypothetical protein